jgi:molecular chaperone DnaK (HSP70)
LQISNGCGFKDNSIQAAINTALIKAHVDKSEIDYVIMIGGSSKNPFVQQKLKKIFSEATVMIPRELQALVSQGAAIHSILKNAFNIQAVRPIVGETIKVVSQNGNVPVIPAGTEVPLSVAVKNVFTTGNRTYKEVEIPVCVGSDKKMLYNLRLQLPNGEVFREHTPVTLHFNMDSDKILKVRAEALELEWEAVCENPLENMALTDGEEKVLKAQRASYVSAVDNGNRPTASALDALSRAYEDNDQEFMAAETLEERIQYYPKNSLYNRIGVLFHNSRNFNRAIAYFRRALKDNPNNATVNNNLGHELLCIGDYKNARPYLEKAVELRGDYAIALTALAELEKAEKNSVQANEYHQRAYNLFKRDWERGELDDCDKGWFISVAEEMGETDIVTKLQDERRNNTQSRGYSLENTLFRINKGAEL